MRGLTTYVRVNESALRILNEEGYTTEDQATSFHTSCADDT